MNSYIDYANLSIKASLKDIEKLCDEAINNHYQSVCVYPYYVSLAKELVKNSNVEVCTLVGYPNGLNTKEVKIYESIDAIEKGANEINLIINYAALKNKDYDYIKEEIEEVRDAIDGKTISVLFDSFLLNNEEIEKIVTICNATYVNYIGIIFNKEIDYNIIDIIKKNRNDLLEIKVFNNTNKIINIIENNITKLVTNKGLEITSNKKCDCDEHCTCGCQDGNDCCCDGNCECKNELNNKKIGG